MKTRRKINKIITVLLICIIAFFSMGAIVKATEETTDITCSDSNLYQVLKERIPSKYRSSTSDATNTIKIKTEAIPEITSLNLSGDNSRKITDISGIEKFSALKELDLNTNNISDLTRIAELSSLTKLDLSKNNISDITPIASNTKLIELNLSNNKISNIESLTTLKQLKVLKLSTNSIGTTSIISNLSSLQELDLSGNNAFSVIGQAITPTLVKLDLSNTGIIKVGESLNICRLLRDLRLANCKLTDSNNLFLKEEITNSEGDKEKVAILRKIETLDLSGTGITSFSNLKLITSLKELYLQNNGISSLNGVYELDSLEYINLNNNKINSLDGIIKTKTEDGNTIIEDRLDAKQIAIKNNLVSSLTPLSYLHEIEYLDASNNKIQSVAPIERFKFEKGIDLSNQTIDMAIYKKTITENQYIILLNILQSAKNPNSIAYWPNAQYTTEGCELNSGDRYQQVPYYNVAISPEKTSKDKISIKLIGGVATGSTINFTMSTSSSAVDSILFEDENLDKAIYEDLAIRKKTDTYIVRAPFIINVSRSIITSTKDLQLVPQQGYEIVNLKGLGNFSNLEVLNLANNHIADDTEIKSLSKLKTLNFANNRLNNNYTSIENLYGLTNLNLDGNNIKDLNSINKLIENITTAKKKIALTDLSISNNSVSDLNVLSQIGTLTNLYIASNNITDISPLEKNTNLKYLDVSGNEIIDISAVSKLSLLENFLAANNIIKDITPLSSVRVSELDLSSNRIKDISTLSSQTSLISLRISNNKIEDISSVENLLIRDGMVAKQQKIVRTLPKNQVESYEIELPSIFLSAKNINSKIYTSSDFELDKCTLSEDGKKIIVNPNDVKEGIAKIKIIGGQADGTTLAVAEMLESEIKYSTSEKTNQDVVATISFNRENVSILNNEGNSQYTFKENGTFTFEYMDDEGFDGSNTATVDWIDKTKPIATNIQYNETDNGIEVTVTTNEQIQNIDGWEFSNDEKTIIKKTFSGESINTKIKIKDEAGNETELEIKYEKKTPDPDPTPDPVEEKIESQKYDVDQTNKTIKNIQPNQKLSDIKANITTNAKQIKVLDKNKKQLSDNSLIGTGATIVLDDNTTYTVMIKGDVDGNGKSDIQDILKINKHRLNKSKIEGIYYTAGNIDNNSKLDIQDILRINKFRLGKIKEL